MFKGVAQTTPKIPDERYTIAEKKYETLKKLPSKTFVVGKDVYKIADFAGLFYGRPTELFKKRILSKGIQRNNILKYIGFLEEVPVLIQRKITGRPPKISWKDAFELTRKMGLGDLTKKNIIKKKGVHYVVDFLPPRTSEGPRVSPEVKEDVRLGFFRRLIRPKRGYRP